MTLQDNLYKILSVAGGTACGEAVCEISLDGSHFIYASHFPGDPITPGVVTVQTAVELLSMMSGSELDLEYVREAKFLKIIRPQECGTLRYCFSRINDSEGRLGAQVTVRPQEGDNVYAKLSLQCVKN